MANATLLVTSGRIDRTGPEASIKVPAGATRIDVAGKFIVPASSIRMAISMAATSLCLSTIKSFNSFVTILASA